MRTAQAICASIRIAWRAPDEQWGERALALVVLRPSHAGTISEDEIEAHVASYADRGVISKWAVPRRVLVVDVIDKTSVGKLDKKLLRQRYAQETWGPCS